MIDMNNRLNDELKNIAESWGFKTISIKKNMDARGGRTVDLISTEQGDFIAKTFHVSCSEERIRKYTLALEYLNNKSTKLSPKIIINQNNGLFERINDRYIYLMEYIEGEHLQEVPEHEYALGQASAVLHSFTDYSLESTIDVSKQIEDMYKRFTEYPFKKEYDSIIHGLPNFKLHKQAFIHTDIGPHNAMLDKQNNVIFVDFDDAGKGSVFIDAGYPLITQFVRYQKSGELAFNEANAKAFYEGYFSKAKLDAKEKELLFHGAVFMQLMYMPCFGEEAVLPMWRILKYAMDNKERIMTALR